MKVFKIKKYHIPHWKYSPYALCSRMQEVVRYAVYDKHPVYEEHEDYYTDMDLCKTCRQMNFVRMVNKLKGKYSA